MKHYLAIAVLIYLSACTERASGPEFDTTLDLQQVMQHVIDPAAIALWARTGSTSDATGEHDLAPATDADWQAAENEAAIVAEGGNLLLMPHRILKLGEKDGEWPSLARRLTTEALAVKAATAKRDTEAMFTAGGRLYEVCVACHDKYYGPFLDSDGKKMANAPKP